MFIPFTLLMDLQDVATFFVLTVPASLYFMPISLNFTHFHGASESMEHLQNLHCLATREGLLLAHHHSSWNLYICLYFIEKNQFAFKGLWSWYLGSWIHLTIYIYFYINTGSPCSQIIEVNSWPHEIYWSSIKQTKNGK